MRAAEIYQQGELAGILEEINKGHYRFVYDPGYDGEPISLALPIRERHRNSTTFRLCSKDCSQKEYNLKHCYGSTSWKGKICSNNC